MKEYVFAIIGGLLASVGHYLMVVKPQTVLYEKERRRILMEIAKIKNLK